MLFADILGLYHIKKHLTASADALRIPHAQLFIGPEGCGLLPMALAYSQYVICSNSPFENNTGDTACNSKCEHFMHPDIHFAFPVANTDKVKSHAVSDHFMSEWRQFLKEQPYGNLFDWYRLIEIEKKQGQIGVDEAQDIIKKLSLKSYEGGWKVVLIWMAEKMNGAAANKLLKLLEEPPTKTLFLLLAEEEEGILQTIRSRCQTLHFPPLAESTIADKLMEQGLTNEVAIRISQEANGNFNKAMDLAQLDSEDYVFEKWFVQWVRSAFKAKGNKGAIHELLLWSEEVSKTGRETQKKYLSYALNMMRQALLINYNVPGLAYMKTHSDGFEMTKFAPFVHENNICEIVSELENAIYHIERNGNSKLIFADLSIKLTRLLHTKAS